MSHQIEPLPKSLAARLLTGLLALVLAWGAVATPLPPCSGSVTVADPPTYGLELELHVEGLLSCGPWVVYQQPTPRGAWVPAEIVDPVEIVDASSCAHDFAAVEPFGAAAAWYQAADRRAVWVLVDEAGCYATAGGRLHAVFLDVDPAFALAVTMGRAAGVPKIFADGWESGDTSAWSGGT